MTAAPEGGGDPGLDPGGVVEVLERALSYLRARLADVRDEHLVRPTPCSHWDLGDLLVHLDDALDALTEATSGTLRLHDGSGTAPGVGVLQRKVGSLLGAWSAPPPSVPAAVDVGGHPLDRCLLAHAAALEVAVHGWDVGVATGHAAALPESLAAHLLPVAALLVGPAERGDPTTGAQRFGPVVATTRRASYAERLLAATGRAVPRQK